MTAKEKATELIEKYICWVSEGNGMQPHEIKYRAKQCALITVDEILKIWNKLDDGVLSIEYDFWQEVKEEITKL